MALRVLLADESTTIKKVMQLALQDFAVEVKAVQSGVDVVEVGKTFQPDIVFADVLLQKKNGYDVCADIKKTPGLSAIPVVLMWSSFMHLDERQAQASRCDRRLEKPFDVEMLRQIVLELVPKTRSHRLAHFLKFPAAEEAAEDPKAQKNAVKTGQKAETKPAVTASPVISTPLPQPPAPRNQEQKKSSWNMDSFEQITNFTEGNAPGAGSDNELPEPFQEMRITPPQKKAQPELDAEDSEPAKANPLQPEERDPWSHQDLARFKLDLPQLDEDSHSLEMDTSAETAVGLDDFLLEAEQADVSLSSSGELSTAGRFGDETVSSVRTDALSLDETEEVQTLDSGEYHREELESTARPATSPSFAPKSGVPQLSADKLEELIRAQSREIIESVVRRIVPDLATEMIREELRRLLQDQT